MIIVCLANPASKKKYTANVNFRNRNPMGRIVILNLSPLHLNYLSSKGHSREHEKGNESYVCDGSDEENIKEVSFLRVS